MIHILSNVWNELLLMSYSGQETGGIVGCTDNVLDSFFYDSDTVGYANAYCPDVQKLNSIISIWRNKKTIFCGVIHTHPDEKGTLSKSDIAYARSVLNHFPLNYVHMPIVYKKNGIKTVDWFIVSYNTVKYVNRSEIDIIRL